VSLRDVDLANVLCLLADVSGHEIRMTREQQRRLSFFASELPIGAALDLLAPTPGDAAVNACTLAGGSSSRLSRHRFSLERIAIADLRVAGLAHVGETWRGYVCGPAKRVMALEPGQRLLDGTVQSIGSNGVTFASEKKGVVSVPFVP
jgi:hypothetical protein